MSVPFLEFNDGNKIPQLGFGVWQVPDAGAHTAVAEALKVGYRHIDTAKIYQNEAGTGRALAESGIAREELFVTTKLWNSDQGVGTVRGALEASLERLGLEYVDLYLIHWPAPAKGLFVETFKQFQEVKEAGLVKSIGVSNFRVEDLQAVIEQTGVTPAINQIELHPGFVQSELRKFHADHGILTEAWSPLGQGGTLLEDPAVAAVAQAHGVTPAQAIIRWHLQLGNVVIPKSVTPARIAANFDVFGFELTAAEVESITNDVADIGRLGGDPAEFSG